MSSPRLDDDPVVRVRGLDHVFGRGEAASQVLFGVDLDLRAGELVILRGASGSGKTTLLTLIACLRSVQAGQVDVLGHELLGARPRERARLRRRLGFIFQAHNLHESLTALDNVRLGAEVQGVTAMRAWRPAALHLLELLGLDERVHYHPADLSGGQKQRVAIARALIANPDIVFADEPTAALDETSGKNVVTLLKRLGEIRGTATLMVTHDERIFPCADRLLTMDAGRVIADVHRSDERHRAGSRR